MEISGRKEWDNITSTNKQRRQQNILCQPCQSDGDTVEAEAFCEICNEFICAPCLKVHRKMAMSKNHVIKLKDEMPKYIDKQRDPCSELCIVHKTEIVKFYCEDHDSVGCEDCVILSHKTCSVKLVSDLSDNYDTSKELEQIKEKIDTLQRELSSHRDEVVTGLKAADEMSERVVKEIKLYRQEMNEYLDDAEKNLLKQIDELKTEKVSQLKQTEGDIETMINEMKDCEKKIHYTSDKINDLFVSAKISQEKIKASKIIMEELASKCEYETLEFVKSKESVRLLTFKCPLGVIMVQKRDIQTSNKNKSLIGAQTKILKCLTVRDLDEGDKCFISGMAVLSSDELLLVDHENCSVKTLNVKENKITSKYTTDDKPWDITSIDSKTFAVTILSKGEILFIKTTNGISKSHSITVKKGCRGIDYRDGVLAISFLYPTSVKLLDLKGDILNEFNTDKYCSCPNHIVLSNDNKTVFVSDYSRRVLCDFSVEGNLNAKISFSKIPVGLVMTDEGTVILCFRYIMGNLEMLIPKTGEMSFFPVRGVNDPYILALSDDQSRIFVYDFSSKNIKVFDII